jgi:hypothetical protein
MIIITPAIDKDGEGGGGNEDGRGGNGKVGDDERRLSR